MAELKLGEHKTMAEFTFNEDESEQGFPSPEDCWELVGSSPSSPLPEASGDVSALEEAMTVACDSGVSLQDGYFGCTRISADNEVLPVSTVMAERQSEDDGHSKSVDDGQASDSRSDALVSLDSGTDAIEICATPSSVSPITNRDDVHINDRMYNDDHMCIDALMRHGDHMHHDDPMCHDDYMHHYDDMCHDGHPYENSLTCHDGHVHQYRDGIEQCKMDDEYCMCHSEIMEHEGRRKIEDGIMCTDEDHAHVIKSMDATNAYHDVCTSTPSPPLKGLDSPSYACISSHDTVDSDMSIQQSFVQGSRTTVTSNELDREVTGHVNKTPESVDVQHGSRQYKGFACTSWIWTQLSKWQAQPGCANTIWSVALAAAVMGIFVLGRGWQRLQAQNQTLRAQLWAKEKRITQLMFQLMQTKDCLSKIKRVPVICMKPSLQISQDHS